MGLSKIRTGPTPACVGGEGCRHPCHDHITKKMVEKEPHGTPLHNTLPQANCLSLLPKKGLAELFEVSSCGGPMTSFSISTTLSSLWEASLNSP